MLLILLFPSIWLACKMYVVQHMEQTLVPVLQLTGNQQVHISHDHHEDHWGGSERWGEDFYELQLKFIDHLIFPCLSVCSQRYVEAYT